MKHISLQIIPDLISPYRLGIPELVALLHSQSKGVFLVSGGFRPIINPVAQQLGIQLDRVFANTILFKVRRSAAREFLTPNLMPSF